MYNGPTMHMGLLCLLKQCTNPESMELFKEDKAFLQSYDSAPRPSQLPVSKLSLFLSLPACCHGRAYAEASCEGEGMDEEPNHMTKPGPL